MSVTIILPVYGSSPWLKEAIESVVNQQDNNWKLLIADDGSDESTCKEIHAKLSKLKDPRIQWVQRPKNLGLFKNLNTSIAQSTTDWILLLCSDDILHPNAVEHLAELRSNWPKARLILSSFDSINADGSKRSADSSRHHDQLRLDTGLIPPEQMLQALLRLGSVNGNLTGMAFTKQHLKETGLFREDWRHAADWEWLIRACDGAPVLINRSPIAIVRTHSQQLSVRNRMSGHECREVAEVVGILLKHPKIQNTAERQALAGHVMQFQLWNMLKATGQGKWDHWPEGLKSIHNSAGIRQTVWSLLTWLPARWEKRRERSQQ